MRCAKMFVRVCVPGPRGATSSLWTRLSPPESLLHPSSCSPLYAESIAHHLYLRALNSITPPFPVSNCKSSRCWNPDFAVAVACVYASEPNYWFESHTTLQEK